MKKKNTKYSGYNFDKRFAELSNETTPQALEIPSDGEEETYRYKDGDYDSNYEIQTSLDKKQNLGYAKGAKLNISKMSSNSREGSTKSGKINEEQLRQKITEQAQRLTQLEIYKQICEQKIRQLDPHQKFPLNENDICRSNNKFNTSLSPAKTTQSNKANLDTCPTSLDRVPIDKLKEMYNKIYNWAQELSQEKEVILESLRIETVNNEEQRNYIEMLRQTIESAVIKQGLASVLQSIRTGMKDSPDNVDILTDIAFLKNESDKYRKELIMAQILITELKQEVEILKKTNEDMSIKKEKIRANLESGIEELEHAKAQVKNLEKEKEEALMSSEEFQTDNNKLIEEVNELSSLNKKYEKELLENNQLIVELQAQVENHNSLQAKLSEYKISFEKLYEDFESLMKEKSSTVTDNNQLKEELTSCNDEVGRLRKVIAGKETKFENEKKSLSNENEILVRNNKKLERMINDLKEEMKEKEREIQKMEEKLSVNERGINKVTSQLDDANLDNEQLKKILEKKSETYERSLKEMERKNNELNYMCDNLASEKLNLHNDYVNRKTENQKLDGEIQNLNTEIFNRERTINKLNNQIENILSELKMVETEMHANRQEKDNLQKEVRFLKEKHDKEINTNSDDITILNRELSNKSRFIKELTESITNLEDRLSHKESQMNKIDNDLALATSEIKVLQNAKDELTKKCEKLSNDYQKEIKNNFELNSIIHNLNLQLEEKNKTLSTISEEKDRIEINRKRMIDELESLKKIDKENQMRNYNLESKLKEYKQGFVSCFNIVNNFANKFTDIIQRTENLCKTMGTNVNVFSANFINTVNSSSFENNLNSRNSNIVRQLEQWIRTVYTEFEILYEQYERVIKELSNQREENKKLFGEVNAWKEEIGKLNGVNENILREMRNKDHLLGNAGCQVEALEERIVILVKEKKYLESLLNKVSKCHPVKDMQRIVNEITALNESVAQMERDRIRLEDSIIQLEEKSGMIGSINSSNNSLLCRGTKMEHSIKKEKDKLRSLTSEYDQKIAEKREHIKLLETQMNKIEMNEKDGNKLLCDYEMKIKNLQMELVDMREELKRNRTLNLGATFRSTKSRTGNTQGYNSYNNNYYVESIDFDDGYRFDSDNNKINSNNQDYTDNY